MVQSGKNDEFTKMSVELCESFTKHRMYLVLLLLLVANEVNINTLFDNCNREGS